MTLDAPKIKATFEDRSSEPSIKRTRSGDDRFAPFRQLKIRLMGVVRSTRFETNEMCAEIREERTDARANLNSRIRPNWVEIKDRTRT